MPYLPKSFEEQRKLRLMLQSGFLPEGVETSSDIYVKLASLLVESAHVKVSVDNIPGILTIDDLSAVNAIAADYLGKRIGNLASTADSAVGSTEELEKLYQAQVDSVNLTH